MSVTTLSGNTVSITTVDVSLTPAEVATIVAPAQTFTVPGVKSGDTIIVAPPAQTAGVAITNAYASDDDEISIQFVNPTAGALTPAAGVHKVTVIRHEGVNGSTRVIK